MRASNGPLLILGALCMVISLGFQNITLASQDYRTVLIAALICMAIADGCFVVVFRRGGGRHRPVAILMASPSLFILGDFLRRALSAFAK